MCIYLLCRACSGCRGQTHRETAFSRHTHAGQPTRCTYTPQGVSASGVRTAEDKSSRRLFSSSFSSFSLAKKAMTAAVVAAVRSAAAAHRAAGRNPLLATSSLLAGNSSSSSRSKSSCWSTKAISAVTEAADLFFPSLHGAGVPAASSSPATSRCLRQPLLQFKAWMSSSSSSSTAAVLEGSGLLVTREAPDFTADAVLPNGQLGKISLSDYRKANKGVVLLFYPLDFTFVCPSELLAFHHAATEFEKLRFQVLGVSVDSVYTHLAWIRTSPAEGGVGPLSFPLVSDLKREISSSFHVLLGAAGVALRGLFIIDRDGVIRHSTVNDLPLGRSVDEALRVCEMVQALDQQKDEGGSAHMQQVCPANWRRGQKMMRATFDGVKEYLAEKEREIKETVGGRR